MTRRLILAWALLALWGSPLRAQTLWPIAGHGSAHGLNCDGWTPAATAAPCPPAPAAAGGGPVIAHPYRTQKEPGPIPCGVPTMTALARVGLERVWMTYVPIQGDEHLLGISMSDTLLFARTDKGMFYVYDQETGRPLWTARLGQVTSRFTPPAVNSYAVFAANLNQLYCLDRRTGTVIWVKQLDSLPSAPSTADEDRVMVGFSSGKLFGFNLKVKEGGTTRISERPIDAWNWQAAGPMNTRPMSAGKFIIFGSDDGKVYVAASEEPTMLFRIATGGPIGAGFANVGTRTILAPSADRNLYAIDLITSKVLWAFPSGSPIRQEPLVAQDDVYIVNAAGLLTSLDPATGSPKWAISTEGGPLITVGAKRIYLKSMDEDLFIVDRATGQMIFDPRSTHERAGLNLRCFEYNPTNRFNDRIFLANSTGLVVAIREAGRLSPTPHRDPKAPPFGYVPAEGISLTPRGTIEPAPAPAPAPAGEAAPAPAPGEAAPPAADTPPAPGAPPAGGAPPAEKPPGDQ